MRVVAITCKFQLLVRSALMNILTVSTVYINCSQSFAVLDWSASWHFSMCDCRSCCKVCKDGVPETLSAAWLLTSPSTLSCVLLVHFLHIMMRQSWHGSQFGRWQQQVHQKDCPQSARLTAFPDIMWPTVFGPLKISRMSEPKKRAWRHGRAWKMKIRTWKNQDLCFNFYKHIYALLHKYPV